MNKYYVEIGELCLERISEAFIVYSKKSIEELEWDDEFLQLVDNVIVDLYNDYGEEDEEWEDFQDSMGIICIKNWKKEYEDYTTTILYDERNE